MPLVPLRSLCALLLFGALATAQDQAKEIRPSPDGNYYVSWFDYDAGAPLGRIRPVVVRATSDSYDIFSFVSVPRYTDAAWNAASTRCVLADAPDNAGPKTWLVYQKSPQQWATEEIEPFETLHKAYRQTDPDVRHLFRPSIIKISWLSNTEVCFRGYCNTGTYLITVDTANPKGTPRTKKLSEAWLDE
jgi:hypothetical protein